jgi:hypothetical protein
MTPTIGNVMPVSLYNTARIPIECFNPECREVRLYLIRDLVANDTVACAVCRKPINLSSDQWRTAIEKTAEYYDAILLG